MNTIKNKTNADLPCPCGSKQSYQRCCGTYINNQRSAPTAQALMRSRYTAYATGSIDYIIKTWAGPITQEHNPQSIKQWTDSVTFIKLDIIETQLGGVNDTSGIVEFCAHYIEQGRPQQLHERSEFKKENGSWYYTHAVG